MNVTANQLLDALARLPVEQRTVIRRSYYDAWTVAQIADDLHVDERTVTTTLHYGVRALLLSLEEGGITGYWGKAPRARSSSSRPRHGQEDSDHQDDSLQDHR